MATMYPAFGPKINESRYAEPKLYHLLKSGLNDDYTVIHSIPWLSSALVEIYNDPSGIGEVDFLIIHPINGILAIEVKGGELARDENGYYYTQAESKSHFDPYDQLNRGVFAIQKHLRETGLNTRLGKGYYFPKTDLGLNVSPEYTDIHRGRRIRLIIDKSDEGNEVQRIEDIMTFYKELLGNRPINTYGVNKVISCLIPQDNRKACWIARIKDDTRTWLKLTNEQEYYSQSCITNQYSIVTGWPGSGKTIVLIHTCRKLSSKGERVLVVTFNRLLADKIATELSDSRYCKVLSFSKLCSEYGIDDSAESDHQKRSALESIVSDNKLEDFDSLFIDEGQAISQDAWKLFAELFKDKRIVVMCDDAQSFGYEKSVSIDFLKDLLQVNPYILTESMRMPKLVCDELALFSTPYYSVINNREVENDTLHRLVTHDQRERLKQVVARILSDGVSKTDICVLKPGYVDIPSNLVPVGVLVENIGRFRGLEKPIVIIYTSENISDSEFFCAYSRATSRCILLLDANHITTGNYGKLGTKLLERNHERIAKISENGLLKNKISKLNINRETVFSDLLKLEWCSTWKMFIFTCEEIPLLQELLLSHFELQGTIRIASWGINSRHHIRVSGLENLDLRSPCKEHKPHLEFCQNCEATTPHNRSCIVCKEPIIEEFHYNQALTKTQKINSILKKEKQLTEIERSEICPFISSSLLLINKEVEFSSPIAIQALEQSKNYIGQVATVHILYLIFNNKEKQKVKISNKKIIEFIKNCIPSINDQLPHASFATLIADAVNKLINLGVLTKIEKGICECDTSIFI